MDPECVGDGHTSKQTVITWVRWGTVISADKCSIARTLLLVPKYMVNDVTSLSGDHREEARGG